jgi:hypothetical protein
MTDESQQLDQIIERFSSSEKALRTLMEAAEKLSTARGELDAARGDLAESQAKSSAQLDAVRRNLVEKFDHAESSLSDVSSGVFGLTVELKDSARDLKDMAVAWRAIGPDKLESALKGLDSRIDSSLKETRVLVGVRDRMFTIWLSGLTVLVIALGVIAIVK